MRTLRIVSLLAVCSGWYACVDQEQAAEEPHLRAQASALVDTPTKAELAARTSAALPIDGQSKELQDRYKDARKRERARDKEIAKARVAELRAERAEAKSREGFAQLLGEAESELSRVEQQQADQAVTP